MKKKIVASLTAAFMVAGIGVASIPFANAATTDWTDGAEITGNKIVAPASETEGTDGIVSREYQGDPIEGTKTYDVIVDLSEEYVHGNLFCISLGFGTDAATYSTEFMVTTHKEGDVFTITSGVAPGDVITLNPGVYTYRWTVSNDGTTKSAKFEVVEDQSGSELVADEANTVANLQNSNCIRYVWAFGREVNGHYVFDRDLVMYKEVKYLDSISVVDGTDGVTPVEVPEVGQKLTANVIFDDGTEFGSYPVNENLSYEWSYAGSDTVLGTDSVYTVTEDNLGKTITVKVTGANGYIGEVEWVATDVVKEATTDPTDPSDPTDPVNPDNPQDKPSTGDKDQTTGDKNTDTAKEESKSDSPKTADPMTLGLLLAAMGASGAGIAGLKKRNK